ncbi:hypothetical protein Barb4_03645 [Bacteroidales bacterium Barb4]|nr:hypothetical protein Barb4_03645 [Bacteroidales bacterium Barb4]
MMKEHRVHRLAQIVVAAKRKGEVAHAAAHFGSGKVVLYPFRGTDKLQTIAVMFLYAGGNSQHIGVENNIL